MKSAMLDYRAGGTLIGSMQVKDPCDLSGDLWIILVYRGPCHTDPYVTSSYVEGSENWNQGYYFEDQTSAMIKFWELCKLYHSGFQRVAQESHSRDPENKILQSFAERMKDLESTIDSTLRDVNDMINWVEGFTTEKCDEDA